MKSKDGQLVGGAKGLGDATPLRLASLAVQNIESRLKLPWRKEGGIDSYFRKRERNIKEIGTGGKREPVTGADFPGRVCLVGDRSSCVDLTGVGVRKKRLAGIKDIKAYAVGVYFNHDEIRRTANRAGREGSVKLLDGVLEKSGKNVIRLVVIFPRATGKQIAKSLDDQIGNKLRQAGHYKDFEAFSKAFDGAKFRKGTTITFSTARYVFIFHFVPLLLANVFFFFFLKEWGYDHFHKRRKEKHSEIKAIESSNDATLPWIRYNHERSQSGCLADNFSYFNKLIFF